MKYSKDKRDIFYRRAKELGYRARSAFKLLQLDNTFHLLDHVKNAVDLCAAPGSWSQVLINRIGANNGRVVAVDLQEMSPIDGIIQLQGDITRRSTAESIIDLFQGHLADIVVCDGAPDVTGMHDMDEYVQSQLILSALCITTHVLRPGGSFVAKVFRGDSLALLLDQLDIFFNKVTVAKPTSSRNSSVESFLVCERYDPPSDYIPTMITANLPIRRDVTLSESQRRLVSFLSCGDLVADNQDLDADASYALSDSVMLPPVAPPIHPPYEQFI